MSVIGKRRQLPNARWSFQIGTLRARHSFLHDRNHPQLFLPPSPHRGFHIGLRCDPRNRLSHGLGRPSGSCVMSPSRAKASAADVLSTCGERIDAAHQSIAAALAISVVGDRASFSDLCLHQNGTTGRHAVGPTCCGAKAATKAASAPRPQASDQAARTGVGRYRAAVTE